MNLSKTLIVVSHPDDEVLGAGGLIYKLTSTGHDVSACILSGNVDARRNRPEVWQLHNDIQAAHKVLGIKQHFLGDFPNIQFNTVPHIKLVQFIEHCIRETQPSMIITHHPSDLNDDHKATSKACQAAARLFQRELKIKPLNALYFMEVLSATDWGYPGAGVAFMATGFTELGLEYVNKKLEALACYRDVLRDYPHPRSKEAITGLAAYRGGQAGMEYAEAYQIAFQNIDTLL